MVAFFGSEEKPPEEKKDSVLEIVSALVLIILAAISLFSADIDSSAFLLLSLVLVFSVFGKFF